MRNGSRNRRRMCGWLRVVAVALAGAVGWFVGCRSTPAPVNIDMSKLRDGSFEGESYKFPASMVVALQVEKGKIAKIEVRKQVALRKYADILKPLIDRIIEKQTTEVDDVTGATTSSRALKRAVQNALVKATSSSPQMEPEKP